MFRRIRSYTLVCSGLFSLGCSQDWSATSDAQMPSDAEQSERTQDVDSSSDLSSIDVADASVEASAPEDDAAPLDGAAAVCSAEDDACDGDTLKSCNQDGSAMTSSVCELGCASVPKAHCKRLNPTAPVTEAQLLRNDLSAVVIPSGTTTFDTSTGAISGALTRAANEIARRTEVIEGIAFGATDDGYGIFSFGKLTLAGGATLKLIGEQAAIIVSSTSMSVLGVIDARPMSTSGEVCPAELSAGPGGAKGGVSGTFGCCPSTTPGAPGAGAGGGLGGQRNVQGAPTSGGGAGHAAAGGKGGNACHASGMSELAGGNGGGAYSSGTLGGSGGGGGGLADGGGGGGYVRLVAAKLITIGDGLAAAGVNAGGCGGRGASAAGGGGSGGTIALEAPFVQLVAKSVLAANGGGGGGVSSGTSTPIDGQAGTLSDARALAGGAEPADIAEGSGGAGMSPAGRGATFDACGTYALKRGGGGSAGTIEVRSISASISVTSVMSPSVASTAARVVTADVR